jgi:hypothetical protein
MTEAPAAPARRRALEDWRFLKRRVRTETAWHHVLRERRFGPPGARLSDFLTWEEWRGRPSHGFWHFYRGDVRRFYECLAVRETTTMSAIGGGPMPALGAPVRRPRRRRQRVRHADSAQDPPAGQPHR